MRLPSQPPPRRAGTIQFSSLLHCLCLVRILKLKDTCFLGKKAMTNLDSILKVRDYFAYKVPYS